MEAMIIELLTPCLKDDEGQFGGRRNTGTSHYLIELIEFILEAFEAEDMAVSMVCADFSKGFNRIHPIRLITTFYDMGIPKYLLKVLISYMSNKRMRVRHNGEFSDEQPLPGGSPQGGLLSIIIFCIYTSGCGMSLDEETKKTNSEDFPPMPLDQKMRTNHTIRAKYVDDTSIAVKLHLSQLLQLKEGTIIPEYLFEDKTKRELTEYEMTETRNSLHDMIEEVDAFVNQNYMKVNEDKSKILFFNNKKRDGTLYYKFKGKSLEQVETMKVLGFQLQSNLKINEHIKMILLKVSKKIWGLRLLMNNGGTVQDGKKFYQSCILSQLEGMVPVWHGMLSAQQRDSLEKVQRRSCKIILKKGYISYANALHVLNLKTLHERGETLCYRFTKKAAKHHPTLYPKKVSARPTRLAEAEQLVVPTFKSEIHKRGVKYS